MGIIISGKWINFIYLKKMPSFNIESVNGEVLHATQVQNLLTLKELSLIFSAHTYNSTRLSRLISQEFLKLVDLVYFSFSETRQNQVEKIFYPL